MKTWWLGLGRRVDNDRWDIDNSVSRRKVSDHSVHPGQSVMTFLRPQTTPQTVCGWPFSGHSIHPILSAGDLSVCKLFKVWILPLGNRLKLPHEPDDEKGLSYNPTSRLPFLFQPYQLPTPHWGSAPCWPQETNTGCVGGGWTFTLPQDSGFSSLQHQ